MTRPSIGTLPGAATLDDESYLDFVEGMRSFNLSRMVPQLIAAGDSVGAAMPIGSTVNDLYRTLGHVPAAQLTQRMMRSTQRMMWSGTRHSAARRAADLESWMDEAERAAPHLLRIDPDFVYPEYFNQQDIHLQPGNYHGETLSGYVFHYGSKIFFTGANDDEHLHRKMADWCPADTQPRRVVDLACGVGQSTTALKERFPEAEVHGVDIAAPMLRYAHARAHSMGLEVHFSQQSAAKTDFADGSVDLIQAMILFHELPQDVTRQVVAEAARILAPGGSFTIIDFPHIPRDELSGRHCMRLFDSWYNGEPFAPAFVRSEFTALLEQHFDNVEPDYRPAATSTGALQIRVCRKSA